jgi:hypothetical protein
MDIDKKFFSGKYIHNIGTSEATVYFNIVRFAHSKKHGKRCCEGRSRLFLEQVTHRSKSEVNEALNKLQNMGLITIEHTYKPLSESKVAIKRREKIGSDEPAHDKNIYYIENIK